MIREQLLFDKYRAIIASASVPDAQDWCKKGLRRIARRRVYQYAVQHHIVDFDDAVLVEQIHQNYRQTVIDVATTQVAAINAATTNAELLVIFDSLEPWLD